MIVYKLTSPSGKSYIGITEKSLDVRLKQQYDKRGSERLLFKALEKYPLDQWSQQILEQCQSRQQLCEREKYYIGLYDTYKTGYNMTLGGDGVDPQTATELKKAYWDSERSIERRQQLSEQFKQNNPTQKGSIPWNKGKKCPEISQAKKAMNRTLTDEHKQKISVATKRRWAAGDFDNRPKPTAETIEKRAASQRGKKQTAHQKKAASQANQRRWLIQCPDMSTIEVLNLRQYALEHKLDPSNLSSTFSGKLKQHKGYIVLKKLN